jgi:hypothetical protein
MAGIDSLDAQGHRQHGLPVPGGPSSNKLSPRSTKPIRPDLVLTTSA